LRNRILIVAALALVPGGIAALGIWRAFWPTPRLDQIRALARVRQFNQAQALLHRYLKVYPNNVRARLLMADLTTEPSNSRPEIALEHLSAIRSDSPKETASVKFLEGKPRYQQGMYNLAETCWTEASSRIVSAAGRPARKDGPV
jgi:hypothetical protein